MTAQEHIAKLKADRKAEREAAERAQQETAEAARQNFEQAFNAAVGAALAQIGAEWLAEYATGETEHHTDYSSMTLAIPGHRKIEFRLERTHTNDPVTNAGWRIPIHYGAPRLTLYVPVPVSSFFDRLDDALLAADLTNAEEEPIPF